MDNSTVSTEKTPTRIDWDLVQKAYTLSLVVYCVAFVLGPIGNGLVIYVTGCRINKTVNSVWFLNLAIADFLFTSLLLLYIINISRGFNWPFGDTMCKLNSMVTVLNMFASIFLLVTISLDRCLSTLWVVWAQNKRTPRKAEVICVGIWLASLACSMPYTVIRETSVYNYTTLCQYNKDITGSTHIKLIVFRFLLGFLIPFLVIIGCYIAIAVRASRLRRGINRKSFRIIVAIVLTFFICWMPFHVIQFLEYEKIPGLEMVFDIGIPLSSSLAFFNSCLNPILYVFMCDEFQTKLRKSVLLVFENAFAEDHGMSFMSSTRSLSSHLSRISRRSESGASGQDTTTSLVTRSNIQVATKV
ncbi:hypothetical protein DPEC_G00145270 [Dallia pectoralis]|uniref:Uncharacterized protein n=1 Tax=Dallia pectoralis TaxID=75939 RepID=A0ACC2GP19_DALPE|nr:hypothetical protein DPEC_G00145270 [Dallia pectoralis]